jgi:hypothetical protein
MHQVIMQRIMCAWIAIASILILCLVFVSARFYFSHILSPIQDAHFPKKKMTEFLSRALTISMCFERIEK